MRSVRTSLFPGFRGWLSMARPVGMVLRLCDGPDGTRSAGRSFVTAMAGLAIVMSLVASHASSRADAEEAVAEPALPLLPPMPG
jgi:hypothetical protein